MQLPIALYGNPVLRKKAQKIEEFTEELQRLAQDMLETMDANNGIGLAAPQIGKSISLFILRNYVEQEDGTIHLSDPQAYINPVITVLDDRIQEEDEGCISLPGLRGNVIRPYFIRIEAFDLLGNKFAEELEGYKARVVMHENDHLNGVLYIDRLSAHERKELEPELRAMKKKYTS